MAQDHTYDQRVRTQLHANELFATFDLVLSQLTGKQRFSLEMFQAGLAPRPNIRVPSEALLRRLCAAYAAMKRDQQQQPTYYQVTGLWEVVAGNHHLELAKALLQTDIQALTHMFSSMGRNSFTTRLALSGNVPQSTKEIYQTLNFANRIYYALKRLTDKSDDVLAYPTDIAGLTGFMDKGRLYPISALRHSYYAERLAALSEQQGTILEIGAGFGGVPFHLFRDCAFQGAYINVDLPEVLILCAYFLLEALPDKKIFLYGDEPLSSNMRQEYDVVLLPNYCIKDLPTDSAYVVFNTHSLTEMATDTVKEYLGQIERLCAKYFFHINHETEESYSFGGVEKRHINLNRPEWQIAPDKFKKVYRCPEVVQNDGFEYPDFTYWEYLYERKTGDMR
jgi:hypothetical protein